MKIYGKISKKVEELLQKILDGINIKSSDIVVPVDVQGDTVNVGNKKKIVFVDASSNTTVAAGANETITIQPPEGKIWKIRQAKLKVAPPAGATSGNHRLKVGTYTHDTYAIYGSSPYDSYLSFLSGEWESASAKFPSNSDGARLSNIVFSYDCPLIIRYENDTDVEQTNARTIKLVVEEEDEAP